MCDIKRAVFIRPLTHVVNRTTTTTSNILAPAYRPACNTVTVLTELHLFQLLECKEKRNSADVHVTYTHL
jgi:hypothetical protein